MRLEEVLTPLSSSHRWLLLSGIDVHYVHVKPKSLAEGATVVPIILVHGWPGSFYEFYGLIPLLTEPQDPENPVFEVVCPSIPGYGFSEAPHKKGECAEPTHCGGGGVSWTHRGGVMLLTFCLQGLTPFAQRTSSIS